MNLYLDILIFERHAMKNHANENDIREKNEVIDI